MMRPTGPLARSQPQLRMRLEPADRRPVRHRRRRRPISSSTPHLVGQNHRPHSLPAQRMLRKFAYRYRPTYSCGYSTTDLPKRPKLRSYPLTPSFGQLCAVVHGRLKCPSKTGTCSGSVNLGTRACYKFSARALLFPIS
ncbi:hypothetical protein BDA96_05G036400 [Sorghum bicolor]|uniref:Uncharacterized protein n=1 Tax=Sorghum bicolor TaxID=4558 RepID=A0A921UEK8_SORBI|nr:hypothetical protein BDA96_05G036400 [Sorghum bicolor]